MKKTVNIHSINVLVCFSVLLSFTLGCRQISDRISEIKSKPITNTRVDPVQSPTGTVENNELDLTKKTNHYISECFNKYSNRVTGSFQRYKSWLKDPEQGPTGKESLVYGLYDVNGDGKDCEEAISKANQMEPSMSEMENISDKHLVALKEVIKQIKNIYPYYDQEDYKDDKFERGKKSHPALLKAFQDFEQINKQFAEQIDKLEDEVAQQNLNLFKDNPNEKFKYLMTDSGIKAKKIARIAQSTEFSQIKLEEIQPLIDDFEKSNTELKSIDSKKPLGSLYSSAADEFLKASKEMMRRIRDKKPFSEFEKGQLGTFAGWTVEGSPDKVIHHYNELIQRRTML